MERIVNASFSLTSSGFVVGGDWLRLVQITDDDSATPSELADLIDQVFGTTPCVVNADSVKPQSDLGTGTEENLLTGGSTDNYVDTFTPVDFVEFNALVKKNTNLPECSIDSDTYNYSTEVKIIKNDCLASHVLRVTNGRVTGSSVVQETVRYSIAVENDIGAVLQYPIDPYSLVPVSFEWATIPVDSSTGFLAEPPSIKLNGTALNWGRRLTGTIIVEYPTRYDVATILIYGTGATTGIGRVTAFYVGLGEDLDLEAPKFDPEDLPTTKAYFCIDQSIPGMTGTNFNRSSNPSCTHLLTREYKCECTGKTSYETETTENVTCPDGMRCSGGIAECDVDLGRVTIFGGYVDCNETTWDGWKTEFYLAKCCEMPPKWMALPRCEEMLRETQRKGLEQELIDRYKSSHANVKFIGLAPEDGECGTTTYKQDVPQRDCCQDVKDLVWDYEHSVTALGDYDSGVIYVKYGKAPIEWVITGEEDFWFDAALTKKRITTSSGYTRIYTGGDACGKVNITAFGRCSSTKGSVRSINGEWYTTDYRQWDFYDLNPFHEDKSCTPSGDEGDVPIPADPADWPIESEYAGTNESYWWRQVYQGEYLFYEEGGSAVQVRAENYTLDCSTSNATRIEESNNWPDCLGVPDRVRIWTCDDDWECKACCYQGDDFVQRVDKYGVVTCGTRIYFNGMNIYKRVWKKWRC